MSRKTKLLLKTISKYILILLFLFLGVRTLFGQEQITITSENEPLNQILSEISEKYKIKFAYDADSFELINTNLKLNNVSLDEFFELLEKEYFVISKLIDGTWVLVRREKQETENSIIKIPPPKPKYITVSGYVKDKNTGENLMYCNIAVGESRGGMTNELGFFNIKILDTTAVRIKISYLGYQTMDTIIPTAAMSTIYLNPSEIVMEAIEVRRFEKQVLQAAPQPDKIAFNPAKSSNTPRISNDDLANALLFIPGVNFIQGSTSGLSIRGSTPTDNLILFDGIPVFETSHLIGNMSVLNSKYVQQVFVSRGGFDAEFGERAAGLIQLTGKSGKNKNPFLDISANLLNTNVLANLPLGEKFSVTAAWRRSFIDKWKNYLYLRLVDNVAGADDSANPLTSTIYPKIKYEDLNAKLSFHPSNNLELNLNILYGRDLQSKDYALLETKDYYRNESVDSETLGFSLNWNWQANNNWFHSFTAGYSEVEKSNIDETGELKEVTEIIENPGQGKGKGKGLLKTKEKTYEKLINDVDNGFNQIEEYSLAWKSEFKTGIFNNLAGVGWTANKYNYDFLAERSEAFIQIDSIVDDETQYMLNAFLQQKIGFTDNFNFRWGLRTNIDLTSGKSYWQPRGGIEFHPVEGLKFYFLSGVYNQFMSGVKRIDSEGRYSRIWYLSDNSGYGAVRSVHYILGTKFEKRGWFIDVEGYLKNTDGKLNFFAEPVNTGPEWIIEYFPEETKEKNTGVDFFLQKKHSIFNHMIGYSLSKTEEKIAGLSDDNWFPAYNDRLHRLKITEIISWKNWTLTGSWQFASGLPIVNLNESDELINPERTALFSQLDCAVVKSFYAKNFSVKAGASLLNILDRKNVVEVNYLRFSSDQEALSVRSDISALAFTPVFFINLKIE